MHVCFIHVLSQRGFRGGYLKREAKPPPCTCPLSCLWTDHRRKKSLGWHCGEVLFCVLWCIFACVAIKRLFTSYDRGLLFYSMPSSSNKWWGISIMNSLNLKAHTQCCSHCLNSHKEHVTMATALHWQNIVLIWDTHKGESDLNTRQFRIPKLWNWYSSQI